MSLASVLWSHSCRLTEPCSCWKQWHSTNSPRIVSLSMQPSVLAATTGWKRWNCWRRWSPEKLIQTRSPTTLWSAVSVMPYCGRRLYSCWHLWKLLTWSHTPATDRVWKLWRQLQTGSCLCTFSSRLPSFLPGCKNRNCVGYLAVKDATQSNMFWERMCCCPF